MNDTGSELPARDPIKEAARQAEIQKNVRNLKSRNPHFRIDAAKRLGQLRAEPLALLEALNEPNARVRCAVVEALGHAGHGAIKAVADGLMAALDDPNNYVCTLAIRALGTLRVVEAQDQLIPFLDSSNRHFVKAAIVALSRLGGEGIVARLPDFLDSEDVDVRLAAAQAAGLLEYTSAGPRLLALLEEAIQNRQGSSLSEAHTYIEAIERLKFREAIPLLTKIAEGEVGLRGAAVQALVEMGASEAAPALAKMFRDPSVELRRRLISLMLQADYRPAMPIIRSLLEDTSVPIRRSALNAVERWHDVEAAAEVRRLCYRDPNPFTRPHAIKCLTALIGREAIADLIALADDPNTNVRRAVAESLSALDALPPEAQKVLERLTSGDSVGKGPDRIDIAHLGPLQIPSRGVSDLPAQATWPVPEEIRAQGEALLRSLERWQGELPAMPRDGEWAERAQALSALIDALQTAQRKNLI
jgi:HEAT repeat protein